LQWQEFSAALSKFEGVSFVAQIEVATIDKSFYEAETYATSN